MVVVLGSGGHSGEMVSLLRNIDPTRYYHRTYIGSSGDNLAMVKALDIERTIQSKHNPRATGPTDADALDSLTGMWDFKSVPRARRIHQSLITAPFSSLWCLLGCLSVLIESAKTSKVAAFEYPDVIITNGPATAMMVILASMILRFFGLAPVWKMKTIYVESFARVNSLSLSGKLLLNLGFCNAFLVQWERLATMINGTGARKKVEWKGFLVETPGSVDNES